MEEHKIKDLDHLITLWSGIYSPERGARWDHILPYYHDSIHFRDSVQELRGIGEFSEMTKRLSRRSKSLEMVIHNQGMTGDLAFIEWEMIIAYKRYPRSSVYGLSRVTLKEGKIIEQRDYYDLWGDIFDNIPFMARGYRRFMRKRFG